MKSSIWEDGTAHPLTINDAEGLTIREAFTGFSVHCDQGIIGIAQRDGGIEVMVNGDLVWSSVHGDLTQPKPEETPKSHIMHVTADPRYSDLVITPTEPSEVSKAEKSVWWGIWDGLNDRWLEKCGRGSKLLILTKAEATDDAETMNREHGGCSTTPIHRFKARPLEEQNGKG